MYEIKYLFLWIRISVINKLVRILRCFIYNNESCDDLGNK